MSGTSSLVLIPVTGRGEENCRLLYKPSPLPGFSGVFVGPVSTTGAAAKWFIEQFCVKKTGRGSGNLKSAYMQMDREAEASPPGSGGIIFSPLPVR